MANHNEPVTYRVYLYDSTALGTDVSAYIQPDYASAQMLAEVRLFQFDAGDLRLQFVDKNTAQSHRYWFNRIAQSASYSYNGKTFDWPMVKVYSPTDTTAPLYVGFIDKRESVWAGDVITSFRALSMLAYADTIDAGPSRNGGASTTTYSGLAETLVRRTLLKVGNAAPGAIDDVVVKDMALGSAQTAVDWNHSLREWQDPSVDPNRQYPLGDFVHVPLGTNRARIGFCVKDGGLYRVDMDNRSGTTYTEITRVSITDAYRVFPFKGPSGINCVAVVSAKARASYVPTKRYRFSGLGRDLASLATTGLMFIPGIGPIAKFGAMLGANLALQGVAEATAAHGRESTGEQYWIITSIRILSCGEGTNEDDATGVGYTFDSTVPVEAYLDQSAPVPLDSPFIYTPADSVCTSQTNAKGTAPGVVWTAKWDDSKGHYLLYRSYWNTDAGGGAWSTLSVAGTVSKQNGRPAGGMAASYALQAPNAGYEVVMVGVTNGYVMHTRKGNNEFYTKFHAYDSPPARFVGALPFTAGGYSWVYFIYGQGKTVVKKQAISINDPTVEDIATSMGEVSLNAVRAVSSYAIDYDIGGGTLRKALGAIYTAIDADTGRLGAYAGLIRLSDYNGESVVLDSNPCQFAIPNGTSLDLRPPHIWLDSGQSVKRMFCNGDMIDGDYLLTDSFVSSLYAVARVHWNFTHEPMTCRQVFEEACRSFYCYLKVYDPDAPANAAQVKIVSRHQYSPTSAGSITTAQVVKDWTMTGIEWYDGVEAMVAGQRIVDGDVGIGRQVFRLSSTFLQTNWARGMAARIVAEYPERSASEPTYPNGRRVFTFGLRKILNGSSVEVKPGYYDLYKKVSLTFGGLSIVGLIVGLGYDRASAQYRATVIEWDDHDVTWTSDEPASDNSFYDLITDEAAIEVVAVVGSPVITVGPMIHTLPQATAVANPSPYPCAYAYKLWLPHGLRLSHYRYGLRAMGAETDSAFWVAVWRDSGGVASYPLEEIEQTRALIVHYGRSPGHFNQELNWQMYDTSGSAASFETSGTGDTSGGSNTRRRDIYIDYYALDPGVYWLMCVQDGTFANVQPANVDWFDMGMPGMGDTWRLSFARGTSGDLTLGTWLENWDTAIAEPQQYTPAIYLVGEV